MLVVEFVTRTVPGKDQMFNKIMCAKNTLLILRQTWYDSKSNEAEVSQKLLEGASLMVASEMCQCLCQREICLDTSEI